MFYNYLPPLKVNKRFSIFERSYYALQTSKLFFKEFVKDWKNVAAFLPTSKKIGVQIADQIDFQQKKTIVEIGPGTGAISNELYKKLEANSSLVLIERNKSFVHHLQSIYTDERVKVIHGDAHHLNDLLESNGIDQVDTVVSSIPMTHLSLEEQESFVSEVKSVMKHDAHFYMLLYTKGILRTLAKAFQVQTVVIPWTFPLHYIFINKPKHSS